MAIVTSLLVSAPMLQDYLVDKDTGEPLAAGIITMYQDNSRTTLKNWYYQTGVPGNYTYIALPNPMTLTSVGTMEDANGNDIIPFYYPYSESDSTVLQPYYVTVDNSNGERQFTRANFPFISQSSPGTTGTASVENYIINNRFWRNVGSINVQSLSNSITINGSTVFYTVLAPSQHDGFNMPDLQYQKNVNGATETITFNTFPDGQAAFQNDIIPEYYINHSCTGLQAGETYKAYQFPISLHIKTLSSVTATVTIQAYNVSGSNQITLSIFQFLGTGVTSPTPIVEKTITLGTAWQKYSQEFIFPSDIGTALGAGGDDAYYLQIGMPLSAVFQINFAIPSLYLTQEADIPSNSFATYDQIDTIINSPRTGDVRTSLNSFYPYGWALMNNLTLCNANSGSTTVTAPPSLTSSNVFARQGVDAWPLFNLIWNSFVAYDSGGVNPIAQMYDSTGATTSYGATAIADWTAFKQLAVTQMMGRVILGTVPPGPFSFNFARSFTASNSGGNLLLTVSSVTFFNGMPIYFLTTGVLPTGLAINTIYYVANFNGSTTFNVAITYANALSGTVIAFTNSGSGNNSVISSLTGTITGEYSHTQLTNELAQHTHIPNPPMTNYWGDGAGFSGGGVATIGKSQNTGTIVNYTGQTAFNIVQPSVYMNMYIKL